MDVENVSNEFEEHKNQGTNNIQVNELTDKISHFELNKCVNPSKASGIALAIKRKVIYEDPD